MHRVRLTLIVPFRAVSTRRGVVYASTRTKITQTVQNLLDGSKDTGCTLSLKYPSALKFTHTLLELISVV